MPGLLASVRTRRYSSALDHVWTHYRRFMHAEAAQLYRCEGAVKNSIYPNGGIGRSDPLRRSTLAASGTSLLGLKSQTVTNGRKPLTAAILQYPPGQCAEYASLVAKGIALGSSNH